jgi:hypothetical protein
MCISSHSNLCSNAWPIPALAPVFSGHEERSWTDYLFRGPSVSLDEPDSDLVGRFSWPPSAMAELLSSDVETTLITEMTGYSFNSIEALRTHSVDLFDEVILASSVLSSAVDAFQATREDHCAGGGNAEFDELCDRVRDGLIAVGTKVQDLNVTTLASQGAVSAQFEADLSLLVTAMGSYTDGTNSTLQDCPAPPLEDLMPLLNQFQSVATTFSGAVESMNDAQKGNTESKFGDAIVAVSDVESERSAEENSVKIFVSSTDGGNTGSEFQQLDGNFTAWFDYLKTSLQLLDETIANMSAQIGSEHNAYTNGSSGDFNVNIDDITSEIQSLCVLLATPPAPAATTVMLDTAPEVQSSGASVEYEDSAKLLLPLLIAGFAYCAVSALSVGVFCYYRGKKKGREAVGGAAAISAEQASLRPNSQRSNSPKGSALSKSSSARRKGSRLQPTVRPQIKLSGIEESPADESELPDGPPDRKSGSDRRQAPIITSNYGPVAISHSARERYSDIPSELENAEGGSQYSDYARPPAPRARKGGSRSGRSGPSAMSVVSKRSGSDSDSGRSPTATLELVLPARPVSPEVSDPSRVLLPPDRHDLRAPRTARSHSVS